MLSHVQCKMSKEQLQPQQQRKEVQEEEVINYKTLPKTKKKEETLYTKPTYKQSKTTKINKNKLKKRNNKQ
ncbi:hypothetical protein DOY81_000977 [Sarcophaga bullata]|nr:hypothetical protein DOY81_000977 [Sarcophaga bullata]